MPPRRRTTPPIEPSDTRVGRPCSCGGAVLFEEETEARTKRGTHTDQWCLENGAAAGRRIEYLPLSSLQGNPRNPKGHDHDTIGASVGRFGLIDIIARDDRTGMIVSGHGRREQLRRMHAAGEHPPEGVVAAGDDWLVPVVVGWSSRTDLEAGAALIALNRSTELGGWVDEALLGLLSDLSEGGDPAALAGVGFDAKELDDLRKLVDAGPRTDLSDIADEWDGESGLKPRADKLTLEIEDPLVIGQWKTWRETFPSDLMALAELLDRVSEQPADPGDGDS